MATSRWAVVLAGGVGSRFWPVSTPERPKQLLPLVTAKPMLRDALDRLTAVAPPSQTMVLTNASLVGAVRALAPELPAENVVAEPRPAGTAAALSWAAHLIRQRAGADAPIVSVHADWAIGDERAYQRRLIDAAEAASAQRALVTVGIVPTEPNPGLGYIEPGDAVAGELRRVKTFIEKPTRERAAELIAAGCLWNSGIFAWCAGDILDEVQAHCPEVAPALAAHPGDAAAFFAAVKSVAIDVGVLERSSRMMVLPGSFGWSDVGTWAALREVRRRDDAGNAPHGRAVFRDAGNNVVHAEGTAVVCYGVDNLVVVSVNGVTLVTTTERAADLKTLLDSLPTELHSR